MAHQRSGIPARCLAAHATITSPEEKSSHDWFVFQTLKKIPGIFTLAIWESIVIPASLSEPTVLHALLGLSYAHYSGTLRVHRGIEDRRLYNENEQLLLKHYVKATHRINNTESGQDSIQITLISCLLFAHLECLRGHFRTAQAHILAGVRILRQVNHHSALLIKNCDGTSSTRHSEAVDEHVTDAFSRIYVQMCLLNPDLAQLVMVENAVKRVPLFANINKAWQSLELILCNIAALERDFHLLDRHGAATRLEKQRQACIAEDLTWWQDVFDRSPIHDQSDARKVIATLVLSSFHAMATVMIRTCLSTDEMQYDNMTEMFLRILSCSASSWSSRSPIRLPGHLLNMQRSIVDVGWIPPLCYTAVKCRQQRIRLHAIRLLESTSHREGFWDANVSSAIARTVMHLEQSNGDQPDMADAFPLDNIPDSRTLALTNISAEHRVSILEIVLPDGPDESTVIRFKRNGCFNERVVSLR